MFTQLLPQWTTSLQRTALRLQLWLRLFQNPYLVIPLRQHPTTTSLRGLSLPISSLTIKLQKIRNLTTKNKEEFIERSELDNLEETLFAEYVAQEQEGDKKKKTMPLVQILWIATTMKTMIRLHPNLAWLKLSPDPQTMTQNSKLLICRLCLSETAILNANTAELVWNKRFGISNSPHASKAPGQWRRLKKVRERRKRSRRH